MEETNTAESGLIRADLMKRMLTVRKRKQLTLIEYIIIEEIRIKVGECLRLIKLIAHPLFSPRYKFISSFSARSVQHESAVRMVEGKKVTAIRCAKFTYRPKHQLVSQRVNLLLSFWGLLLFVLFTILLPILFPFLFFICFGFFLFLDCVV
mmetsp:Transcript_1275/g.1495  ORF Transcript_1275/g.1495 Transcript_1275/m.1495 type:complete len:151 (+) Transcript_1275:447-899(+)